VSEGKPKRRYEESLWDWMQHHRGLFPTAFTVCAMMILGAPTVTGIRLALNPSTRYWIGRGSWSIMLVPLLLIVSHFMHVRHKRPKFVPVVLATVFPSVVIFFIGYGTSIPIGGIVDRLYSSDCHTDQAKYHLEEAHRVAGEILQTCANRVSRETGVLSSETYKVLSLEDCAEYKVYFSPGGDSSKYGNWKREWQYLKTLENEQLCSGFCNRGRALWRNDLVPRDICSNSAATVMESNVRSWSRRLMALGIIDFIVSGVTLFSIQEILNKLHLEW